MDLNDCFRKGMIKKTVIDNNLIRSLVEMADAKEIAVKKAVIDEVTVSAFVSLKKL